MHPINIALLGFIGVMALSALITWDAYKPHKQKTP